MDTVGSIIALVLGSNVVSSIVSAIVARKTTRVELTEKEDNVLTRRIEVLEGQIRRLEEWVCMNKKCQDRV